MSIVIKPQIRKTSEIKFHYGTAPGKRYVFVDKKLYPQSEFYIIGRRVESVPKDQPEYVKAHRHNCNSYYFFIGDNEDLSGLKGKVVIEGNKKIIESPSSVLISEKLLHTYKLIDGKGWFIHIVLKPDFNSSLFGSKAKKQKIKFEKLCKKFEKQERLPKKGERPIVSDVEFKNPQRWILISPKLFEKAGIYVAIHQIFSDKPFGLKQKLHANYEDEVYLLFTKTGDFLEVDMYSSENKKEKIKSPMTVYHPKKIKHRYDYVKGKGFMLVVLKERIPGEGYKYIPIQGS